MGILKTRGRGVLLALLLAAAVPRDAAALAAPTAQQVEAVFLFYFTQFVSWPASAFASEHSPIIIGVLGDDPFNGALEQAVAGERVNGRPILVRRLLRIADAQGCHIVYISASEAPRLQRILSALNGHEVLTVSDLDHFAQSGGMIRFVLIDQHVRLRINASSARAAGLTLSSKLLRAAAPARPGAS